MGRESMNPLCPCRKAGAWRTRQAAQARLDEIQASPNPTAMYAPVNVDRCAHGIWHLTSKAGKPQGKGKSKQKRRSR